jgi:hypothetical protein
MMGCLPMASRYFATSPVKVVNPKGGPERCCLGSRRARIDSGIESTWADAVRAPMPASRMVIAMMLIERFMFVLLGQGVVRPSGENVSMRRARISTYYGGPRRPET